MSPNGICNKEGHIVAQGACLTCLGSEPDYAEITKQTLINPIEPRHYTSMAIPPNEYITANKLEWEVANTVKYISRYKSKNGKEDLLKAIKYIEMLIEREYGA